MSREHQFIDCRQHYPIVLLFHLKFLLHTEGMTYCGLDSYGAGSAILII